MRFSLKTLVVLVLFFALGSSLVAKLFSIRALGVEATRLRQVGEQQRAMMHVAMRTAEDQQQIAARWKLRLKERTRAEQTIQAIFDKLVEGESAIQPSGDQIAIRDVPMIVAPLDFQKKWMIHVPASRMLSLRMDFTDQQDKVDVQSTDFVSQQAVVVPLPVGLNQVKFHFGKDEQGKPTETFLEVNGTEVARLKSLHTEQTGSSSSVFVFDQQQDYPIGAELPTLVKYCPSPGDTKIRIRLTEDTTK